MKHEFRAKLPIRLQKFKQFENYKLNYLTIILIFNTI